MLAAVFANPWRFQPNPEVYLLVAFLVGAYVYMVRTIGPTAVPEGTRPISRRNLVSFVAAMVVLFAASTYPIHQIGEEYLYSVHMVQHAMLAMVFPPLVLFATPEWLVRALLGSGRTWKVFRFLALPVIAGVLYNALTMVLHIPGVVNTATTNGPLHFALHLVLVLLAVLMWTPIVGPIPEWRIGWGAQMIYLFLMGIVPTVPAGWMAFAEKAVYSHYGDQRVRVWGMSPLDDQQLAGLIMKVFTGWYMWAIIIFVFFRRFALGQREENSYRR
jgi:putative membrane protein